jgi:DNA-binding GntR family transcriptional regulator
MIDTRDCGLYNPGSTRLIDSDLYAFGKTQFGYSNLADKDGYVAKLGHMPLNERVYHHVREAVVSGVIPPNGRLDEQALADEMGVSRTPIREAIGKLTREGLVEYRPYQGNFVRAFTARQINDLYEVRKSLEALAMRLAVPKLTEANVAELKGILNDVHEAHERGDLVLYGTADRRFHNAIAHFSGNETLIESLDRLSFQVQLVRAAANRDPGVVERTAKQRPAIFAALEARDADEAARLMAEHIDDVRRTVVSHLESQEGAADAAAGDG